MRVLEASNVVFDVWWQKECLYAHRGYLRSVCSFRCILRCGNVIGWCWFQGSRENNHSLVLIKSPDNSNFPVTNQFGGASSAASGEAESNRQNRTMAFGPFSFAGLMVALVFSSDSLLSEFGPLDLIKVHTLRTPVQIKNNLFFSVG